MSSVEVINVSAIKTPAVTVNLPGTTAIQSQTLFAGGYSLCYTDILSNLSDIQVKKFTNFYLTPGIFLDDSISTSSKSLSVDALNTSFKSIRNNKVVVPNNTSDSARDINLVLSSELDPTNSTFNITFIDKETCKISYTKVSSRRYVVVNAAKKVVLRKSSSITNDDNVLNYVLNDDKLILFKRISGKTYSIVANDQDLTAVEYTTFLFKNIKESAFLINPVAVVDLPSFLTADYITYKDSSLNVDEQKTVSNVPINYLISKTSYNNGAMNIVALKNYAAETGKYGRFNTLALSASDSRVLNRVYTSINSNIDQPEDGSLSLNYVCYNQAYTIFPGLNTITTGDTIYPFNKLNVNNTTFIDCGSYGSTSPIYSDKIYYEVVNNRDERVRYLCTWLYRNTLTDEYVWLDRYYYPNLITKSESLINPIYNPTYDNYVESIIQANTTGSFNSLTATQYFDKISDLVFEPNKAYTYDRINYDTIDFLNTKNNFNATPGYYNTINDNYGFTFAFRLNEYTDTSFITIQSKFNSVPGGIKISFNQDVIDVTVSLFNTVSNSEEYKYSGKLGRRTKSSFILHVDILRGVITMFLDNVRVVNNFFTPLLYPNALYGDIFVSEEPLSMGFNYLDDIFLSTSPLHENELEILRTKYNTFNSTFNISLPCGMRNRVDSISQIQALHATTISKSNTFDISIDNLSISNEEKEELQKVIEVELNNLLPVNSHINNIKIT